jgi:restriction endonuclease Mrr
MTDHGNLFGAVDFYKQCNHEGIKPIIGCEIYVAPRSRHEKGVFISTGRFSEDAIRYVESIDPKVILIHGRTLCELMINYGLGTATTAKYEIKRIDSDYFSEE